MRLIENNRHAGSRQANECADLFVLLSLGSQFKHSVNKFAPRVFLHNEMPNLAQRFDGNLSLESQVRHHQDKHAANALRIAYAPRIFRLPARPRLVRHPDIATTDAIMNRVDYVAIGVGDAHFDARGPRQVDAALAVDKHRKPDREVFVWPSLEVADVFVHAAILHRAVPVLTAQALCRELLQ